MVIVEVSDGKRRKLVPLAEAVSLNGIANIGNPDFQFNYGDAANLQNVCVLAGKAETAKVRPIVAAATQKTGNPPSTIALKMSGSNKLRNYHLVREKLEAYQDAHDKAYGTVAVGRREDKEAFLRISRSLG